MQSLLWCNVVNYGAILHNGTMLHSDVMLNSGAILHLIQYNALGERSAAMQIGRAHV